MRPRGSRLRWGGALLRNLLRGHARDADLRANVGAFVDLLTDEKIADGMTPEAARRAAMLECGSIDAVVEDVRDVRAGALVAQVWQDTRFALRVLRREPTFSAVAILTLALGIGANTAIFSVVNAVLLEPLPYADPERLVLMWERNTAAGKDRDPVAPPNFLDWRRDNTVFDELAAYRFREFALTHVEQPEQLQALSTTASVFRVLGVAAALGRPFTDDEEHRRERVAVLSHTFWQRRFGGDPSVVGRSVALDGAAFTIVGVMPAAFQFPDDTPVDLYSPIAFAPNELNGRRSHTLTVIGRLKPGVTVQAAHANIGGLARAIAADDSGSNPEVAIVGAHDALVEDVRLGLMILLGTVGLVLLVACANVANLLLVRAAARRRELAMRAALGAGRSRLLRQMLTESVVLAGLGAGIGLGLAWSLLRMLVRVGPQDLPRLEGIAIDTPVLLFTTVVAMVTGIAFGVVPALAASRRSLTDAFKESSPQATATFATSTGRAMLLVGEIALSLTLLAGAGLMVRSLINMQNLDLGFQPANVLTAQIFLPPSRYPVDPAQYRPAAAGGRHVGDSKPVVFLTQLEERLNIVRGVESVGAVSALPLNPVGIDYDLPVIIQDRPRPRVGEEPQADFRVATTGYFRTMKIPVLRGREFTDFDGPNSTPVITINDTLAQQMFPGADPLGQRILLYGRPREIVAVVGSVRHHGFTRDARPEMIVPYRQFQFGGMTLVVRSQMERAAVAAEVERAVHALDAQLPVSRVRMMPEFLAASVAQPRFTTLLLTAFAALALVLAVVGIYGVMSYSVSQRTREMAVRLALGARPRELIAMVVGRGLTLAAIGVTLGLIGAIAATRLMTDLLFGVSPTDPATLAAAVAALILFSLAATYVPAARAATVAPASLLKAE
jgi:putative ABC transport system permease protein